MSVTTSALLRVFFLLLCFVAGSWELSITEVKVPQTIVVGKDAELNCHYELGDDDDESSIVVKWYWTPASSSNNDKILIYQRIAGQTAIILQRHFLGTIDVKNNDSIILKNIQPSSSGVYGCEASSFTAEVRKHETLTVVSKSTGPVVNLTEIEDNTEINNKKKLLEIVCRAEEITPKPNLKITINGHNVDTTTIVEDNDHNGLYKATANIILSGNDSIHNGENEVRCEMSYGDSNVTSRPYLAVKLFVPSKL